MNIVKIRTKTEEGETEVSTLELIAGLGIKGDKKAKGGDRQICLSDEKLLASYRAENEGLCTKRFMPNITTCGIDYSSLKEGDILKLDETEIEISGYKKKCFEECPLYSNGRECQIKNVCAFGRIIKGGEVKIDSQLTLLQS